MPYLPAKHTRLAYDVTGDGRTVVQLHGLTSSRRRDAQIGLDLCRGLSGHRIIRYDARGHGESAGRQVPSDYTWPQLADDLLHLLGHEAPSQQVHGVGQSMGAGTLLHAAVADPARFATLVLGIPPTAWSSRVTQARSYRQSADLVERNGVHDVMEAARSTPRPPAVGAGIPIAPPDVDTSLLPSVFRGAAATDFPAPQALAGLRMPTLLLCWVQDPAHPVSTAERLGALLPHHRLVVAHTPADATTWPDLIADHLSTCL